MSEQPAAPEAADMRYDTASLTAFGANVAALFRSMTVNGMRRKEALNVVLVYVEGMMAVIASRQEDPQ